MGKLHNEEIHILQSSPNIIRFIISRKMKRARRVTHTSEVKNTYKI